MDCSLPDSSAHWISQARTLEWVVISSSRGSSRPRDWARASCTAGQRVTGPGPGLKNHSPEGDRRAAQMLPRWESDWAYPHPIVPFSTSSFPPSSSSLLFDSYIITSQHHLCPYMFSEALTFPSLPLFFLVTFLSLFLIKMKPLPF